MSSNTMVALAIMAILCPILAESLAFTGTASIASKSSSTFTCSTTNSQQQIVFTSESSSLLTMKVSGGNKRTRSSKSSNLIELNNQRLQIAGRPGTKKFQDPNKVFIGNLPYDATESDVTSLFSSHWNIPSEMVGDRIESIKIIRDWKTGQSKGYGFVQFYEPMIATSAMESVNKGPGRGWRIKGRRIRLDQGVRNESGEEDERNKKKKLKQQQMKKLEREDLDEEGLVIHSVLEDVEGGSVSSGSGSAVSSSNIEEDEDEDDNDDGLGMSEDDMITFMEKGGLRGVMPLTEETAGFLGIEGLYDDDNEGYDEVDDAYFEEYYNANGYSDGDFDADIDKAKNVEEGDLEDEEDDGEEIVYDGVFEEIYNPKEFERLSDEEEESISKMNREQRRAEDKKRKKRKLPFKGFGPRD